MVIYTISTACNYVTLAISELKMKRPCKTKTALNIMNTKSE